MRFIVIIIISQYYTFIYDQNRTKVVSAMIILFRVTVDHRYKL